MLNSGNHGSTWLRPIPPSEHGTRAGRGGAFERAGYLVQPDLKLNQLVHRRPPGITAHQWSSAIRTRFDFVVCDAGTFAPLFAVEFIDPTRMTPDTRRNDRMIAAVCEAVGLEQLRVESSTLGPQPHGRRIVEYVIDARSFANATSAQEDAGTLLPEEPVNYRDIIGRLPDGRSGFVNDLAALARAAAVEAYAARRLADPILRGLHACWKDGPAEGWGWLDVRDGLCIFERTRVWQHRFSCGIDPGRLAEDLAAVAVGERLKTLDPGEPALHDKRSIGREFDELRRRRDEMAGRFAFDHVSFE